MSENELHPLASEVGSQLKSADGSFMMLVYFKIKDGQEQAMRDAFKTPLLETVKEEGNFTYRLMQQTDPSTTFIVIEHWKDLASLDAHLKQPYLTQLLADLESILDDSPHVDVFNEYVAM